MRTLIKEKGNGTWTVLKAAGLRFLAIDGGQRSAAFAYSAFFALFPIILLTVSAASYFLDPPAAAALVVSYMEKFVPAGGGAHTLFSEAILRVINARGQAGAIALLMLVWVAAQFFTTLIQAVNRAWGTPKSDWWKLPLKSLTLLGVTAGAMLIGIGAPMVVRLTAAALPAPVLMPAAQRLALFILPWLAVFLCITFFYQLAPHRKTKYSEVRLGALSATVLLFLAQSLFVLYFRHFASFNAVYGAFGGLMALLVWIYASGGIFIFCACLSAVGAAAHQGRHA